jgi:hypothetical protein
MSRKLLFWDFIRNEAAIINADGCTGVSNIYGECCLQHDLEYFWGVSATSAYRHYREDGLDYWRTADPVTFDQANENFKRCHFRQSKAGYLNVFAWWRYAVVRTKKGRSAWDGHRERETLGIGA